MNNTAARIRAAARRMHGVIIEADGNDSLSIDARGRECIADEGMSDLEGEYAANLISEARAYVVIAEGEVSFDDALAFVVEGYLSIYRKTIIGHATQLV